MNRRGFVKDVCRNTLAVVMASVVLRKGYASEAAVSGATQ